MPPAGGPTDPGSPAGVAKSRPEGEGLDRRSDAAPGRLVTPLNDGRSYFGGWVCAVSSMAEALRWRAVGRCASQHDTEQNISLIRPELQVETEQRQYFEPS